MKKWLRFVAAGCSLLLGLAGLLLPVLPGFVFIAICLLLLSPEVPIFKEWLHLLERRIPMSRAPLHRLRQWLD